MTSISELCKEVPGLLGQLRHVERSIEAIHERRQSHTDSSLLRVCNASGDTYLRLVVSDPEFGDFEKAVLEVLEKQKVRLERQIISVMRDV